MECIKKGVFFFSFIQVVIYHDAHILIPVSPFFFLAILKKKGF